MKFLILAVSLLSVLSCKSTKIPGENKEVKQVEIYSELLKQKSVDCDESYVSKISSLLSKTNQTKKLTRSRKQFFSMLLKLDEKELNEDAGYGKRFVEAVLDIDSAKGSLRVYKATVSADCSSKVMLDAFRTLLNSLPKYQISKSFQEQAVRQVLNYAGAKSRQPLSYLEFNYKLFLLAILNDINILKLPKSVKGKLLEYIQSSKSKAATYSSLEESLFSAEMTQEGYEEATRKWLVNYKKELKELKRERKKFLNDIGAKHF